MAPRMLSLAIKRVSKPCGRSVVRPGWPVVAHISPESASLRLTVAWSEYRHGRIVTVQLVGGEHVTTQRLDQWRQQGTRFAHPLGQSRTFEVDAFAGIDLGLPV